MKVTTSCQFHKCWSINLIAYGNELFVHEFDKKVQSFIQNLISHSKVTKKCAYYGCVYLPLSPDSFKPKAKEMVNQISSVGLSIFFLKVLVSF